MLGGRWASVVEGDGCSSLRGLFDCSPNNYSSHSWRSVHCSLDDTSCFLNDKAFSQSLFRMRLVHVMGWLN